MGAIEAELADVARNGLPDDEIESGKQQLRGQITLSMESVSSRMYRAASPELYGEPYRTLDQVLDRVQGITMDEVRAVCSEFFSPEAQTVVTLGPEA
jgi:predicted Zn-dependent peptidase